MILAAFTKMSWVNELALCLLSTKVFQHESEE